jgi:CheY-like chemotaxis protein
VQDNGIGIAPGQIPHLFKMFTQADTSLERTRDGLGIGLTLVKGLVEMHGGTIAARSDGIGHGSTFEVRLPALTQQSARIEPMAEPPRPIAVEGQRVLIVDDNYDGAESLAMLLEEYGHETHLAHDGAEALEVAERVRPDAVLLDIGLPKLNGYEVCRRLRQHPWGEGLLLAALTGWGQEEDRQRSVDAGFDTHLVKPVDHDLLLRLLASHGSAGDAARRAANPPSAAPAAG